MNSMAELKTLKYLHPMNWTISCIFFIASFSLFSQDSLVKIENFGTNPGNLEMFIYPLISDNSIKKPLIIALHGCNQRANNMAELTGWNKLADQHNFLVLYPQQKLMNNSNLCFNWFKDKDISGSDGESASIKEMIDYAVKNYSIDTSRIFITGLSAGAAMSVALLVNYPETIKAGASFAGGPYGITNNSVSAGLKLMLGTLDVSREELINVVKNTHSEQIVSYPALFIYHGEIDPVVNKKNANWLVEQWTGIHETDSKVDTYEHQYNDIKDLDKLSYTNQNGDVVVTYYKIKGVGHVVPIDQGELENQGGRDGLFSVDIDFHSTYQVAKDFGLIQK